jgi:hypothetical protein
MCRRRRISLAELDLRAIVHYPGRLPTTFGGFLYDRAAARSGRSFELIPAQFFSFWPAILAFATLRR